MELELQYPETGTALDTAPAASTSSRRTIKRLSPQGYKLIDELYAVNPSPSVAERWALLARIQALPGCEHYTFLKLSNIFQQRRRYREEHGEKRRNSKGPRTSSSNHLTSNDILYPSLVVRPDTILKLEILFMENASPSELMVKIWAKRLQVEYEDVQTWVELKNAFIKEEGRSKDVLTTSVRMMPHLPTPGSSCSPEPSQFPAHSRVQRTSTPSPISDPGTSGNHFLSARELQELARTFHDVSAKSSELITVPPRSADEFDTWFEEHGQKMSTFLQRVEQGEYAQWGFEPGMLLTTVEEEKSTNLDLNIKTEPHHQST